MLLSVMVMGTGAASFTDEDEFSPQYAEAAEVLTGMGVIQGYDDGSFLPQRNITRAQVATMIYRAVTHDVTDSQTDLYKDYNKFEDVPSTDWSAGYVGYCANGELIKGFTPTTFGPTKNVTGYQVLAMILRAIGYDQNDEFTGAGWEIRTATTAQQLGILENVQEATLGQPATRELVAELIFQAMSKPDMVDYTPALGYQPIWPRETLGEDEFGLWEEQNTADVWGRPSDTWHYNTGDKETAIEQAAAHTYTTAVSECDIANDLGLTKTTALEKAYIDGESQTLTSSDVTTNRYASINPLATTSYVGAQGRVTEVYDMGDAGLRLVEINTYLAVVDKVTAATTDKNGHTTDATVDLTVYSGNNAGTVTTYDMDKVVASGYSVGDYVLVQISNPGKANAKVQSIELAPVIAGGEVDSWTTEKGTTPATTTVGDETYNEANKFYLNRHEDDGIYNVITDKDGNVIGLVEATTNYLVIEAIEWKHDGTLRGGYALADVVLADGTRVEDVTVSTVGGTAVSCADDDTINFGSKISDRYSENDAFYNHLITYTVDANGNYALGQICTKGDNEAVNLSNVVITKGQSTIYSTSQVGKVVADNSTVYLVKDAKDGTYTTYVGKDNVPSMKDAGICYLVGEDGFLSVVVVYKSSDLNNTFLAYVTDGTVDSKKGGLKGYEVYKLGETTPTTVYDSSRIFSTAFTAHATGLYLIEVNSDNEIVRMQGSGCDSVSCTTCNTSWAGSSALDYSIDRMLAASGATTGSLMTYNYNADGDQTTANKDFIVNDNTVYVKATVDAGDKVAELAEATASDVEKGDIVLVLYTTEATSAGVNKTTASYVYIIKADEIIDNPVAPVTYTVDTDKVTATIDTDKKTINVGKAVITSSDGSSIPTKAITVSVEVQSLASSTGSYNTVTSGTAQIPTTTAQASPYTIGSAAVQLKDTLTPGTYNVIVTVSIGGTTSSETVSLTVNP